MMGTSPAGTVSRAAPTSRFFSPRPLYQPWIPAFLRPLLRSGHDEFATAAQSSSWYCRCYSFAANRRCGVRQALVPIDDVRGCAPLRPAGRCNSGGTREFSFSPRNAAALLEIDGGGLVSDAAFAGLLVLLRFPESLFRSQPGHRRHTLPAGARVLSFGLCFKAAFGLRGTRDESPPSRFRPAHFLVAGPVRLLRLALAARHPGFHEIQSHLLSPRVDSASDDHHRAGGRVETHQGTLAHFLRQLHLLVRPDRRGESPPKRGHRSRCLLFRRFLRYALPA